MYKLEMLFPYLSSLKPGENCILAFYDFFFFLFFIYLFISSFFLAKKHVWPFLMHVSDRPFSYCIDQAGLGAFTAKSGRIKHYNPPPLTVHVNEL